VGFFDRLRSKPKVAKDQILTVVVEIDRRLRVTREQFVFAITSTFEAEGCLIPGASRELQIGSEMDAALCGFQLTNVLGFAWKSYVNQADSEQFRTELASRLGHQNAASIAFYNDRYLDCEGNIECITDRLASDIHRLWGAPEPSLRIIKSLTLAARALGAVSQAAVAAAVGDNDLASKLRAAAS
jgi:hypothetical protein